MYIYKTTNEINGKIYIGKSSKHYTNNNEYYGSGTLLKKAIEKYGKENFTKEILEECDNNVHLDEREVFWINELNSTTKHNNYNITLGGTGGDVYTNNPNYDNIINKLKTRRHTQETKDKISKNNSRWNKGKTLSEETKRKIGNANKGNVPWNKGKKDVYSEETKLKMSKNRKGIPCKHKGRTDFHSEESKLKISKKRKGRIWVNNGKENKMVYKDEIPDGFVVGRGKVSWS